jgi:hypothetical protein
MVRIVGSEEADFGRESYALFFFLSIFQGARKGAFRRVSIAKFRIGFGIHFCISVVLKYQNLLSSLETILNKKNSTNFILFILIFQLF